MDTVLTLRGHLLVAMPSLHGQGFEHAVIYVCEHQMHGSVGLIINKPLIYPVSSVFDQLKIESSSLTQKERPLLFGGPMQTERGFVMHRPSGHWRSSLLIDDDVTITTSNDIIHALARDEGPKDAFVMLGFVGWDSTQLQKEILNDAWLVCPCKPEILYDLSYEKRWEQTAALLGVHMNQIIENGGHA